MMMGISDPMEWLVLFSDFAAGSVRVIVCLILISSFLKADKLRRKGAAAGAAGILAVSPVSLGGSTVSFSRFPESGYLERTVSSLGDAHSADCPWVEMRWRTRTTGKGLAGTERISGSGDYSLDRVLCIDYSFRADCS